MFEKLNTRLQRIEKTVTHLLESQNASDNASRVVDHQEFEETHLQAVPIETKLLLPDIGSEKTTLAFMILSHFFFHGWLLKKERDLYQPQLSFSEGTLNELDDRTPLVKLPAINKEQVLRLKNVPSSLFAELSPQEEKLSTFLFYVGPEERFVLSSRFPEPWLVDHISTVHTLLKTWF